MPKLRTKGPYKSEIRITKSQKLSWWKWGSRNIRIRISESVGELRIASTGCAKKIFAFFAHSLRPDKCTMLRRMQIDGKFRPENSYFFKAQTDKERTSSIEVDILLFSGYARESNIPNKNVAMSSAKPTMVADLSSSSCSITNSFQLLQIRIKSTSHYVNSMPAIPKKKKTCTFISIGAFAG
jgi:hypothetical protein